MAYITLTQERPGIVGLMQYRPETGAIINALADFMLRGENTLTPGERELIAAHVSSLNDCEFCTGAHSACAAAQLPGGTEFVDKALADPQDAEISPKLRALLQIAAATRSSGLDVTPDLVEAARAAGAVDLEIHDTVLIAAMFSLTNRYVDGLRTALPEDPGYYAKSAEAIIEYGYAAATSA
jgi:uncharacterized peroxidase-related enzyme